MTEVAFHFNIADKIGYTCRLLRKAVARLPSAVVVADADTLQLLDEKLWQLSATDFVGHLRLPLTLTCTDTSESTQSADALYSCARVLMVDDLQHSNRHDVLVNLLPSVPTGFEQFARLVEIVSLDADDRTRARERWRHYSARGYSITKHDAMVRAT